MRKFAATVASLMVVYWAGYTAHAGERVTFRLLQRWCEGRVKEPAVHVLKDQDSHVKLFRETYAQFIIPTPEPEKVDFKTDRLVAIFWGAKPSTGYGLSLVSVTGTGKETTITVKTSVPTGMTGAMITHPALVLAIPKAEKVKIIVTGDRKSSDMWWPDFSNSEGDGWEVSVR